MDWFTRENRELSSPPSIARSSVQHVIFARSALDRVLDAASANHRKTGRLKALCKDSRRSSAFFDDLHCASLSVNRCGSLSHAPALVLGIAPAWGPPPRQSNLPSTDSIPAAPFTPRRRRSPWPHLQRAGPALASRSSRTASLRRQSTTAPASLVAFPLSLSPGHSASAWGCPGTPPLLIYSSCRPPASWRGSGRERAQAYACALGARAPACG